MKPRYLMSEVRCRPHATRDRLECEMHIDGLESAFDLDRAERQHDLLRCALQELGGEVNVVPFVHGAPDSVFVKDNAVVVEEHGNIRALLCQPRNATRDREQYAREHTLEALGIDVVDEAGAPLEGGDVVLLPQGRGALLGWGPRSSIDSLEVLESFLDVEVTPLELTATQGPLCRLENALAILNDGTVLACREAFTAASWRVLALTRGVRRIIEVPVSDALAHGLSFVEHDGAVVMCRGADTVERILTELGREPVALPLEELAKAGTGVAALVARVHEAPVTALLRRNRPQPAHVDG